MQADLFHIMDHGLAWYARHLRNQPYLVTVHDLISYMAMIGELPVRQPHKRQQVVIRETIKQIRGATRILSVSTNTADCLVRFLKIPSSRIVVVHNYVSPDFRILPGRDELRKKWFGGAELALLHVGKPSVYKNRVTVIRAFAEVRRTLPGTQLWLVNGALTEEEQELVAEERMGRDVHRIPSLERGELVEIYNAADVFVFPSIYEGFGVPPLEAMACGCPVVATTRASLGEVIGDGGITIADALDHKALAGAIRTAAVDESLRRDLREKGLRQAAKFSQGRTLSLLAEIYGEALR